MKGGKDILETRCIKTRNGWFLNNCYFVRNTENNHAILIDPSWEEDKFIKICEEYQCIVDGIFLTHFHFDHTNLAKTLSEQYDCLVFLSDVEAALGDFDIDNLFPFTAPNIITTKVAPVQCHRTPGHSINSITYQIEDMLFCGDTLFNEGCGFPDQSEYIDDLYESIQFLKENISLDTRLYPGHSYGTNVGLSMKEVFKTNIYLYFDNRADFSEYLKRNIKKGNSKFT